MKAGKNYEAVLFDLDGTLTDSGPGIMASVQYALSHFGRPAEPESILRKFVGPSLMDSFTGLYGMTEEEALRAVSYYRSVYTVKGIFEASVYEGIRELLEALSAAGKKNVLVTSKPHNMAERVLRYFDLEKYFFYHIGPEPDDHSSRKSRLIEQALKDCGIPREAAVMVGDTRFDVNGAREAGVDVIAVSYGYGERKELLPADYLASSPAELMALLL